MVKIHKNNDNMEELKQKTNMLLQGYSLEDFCGELKTTFNGENYFVVGCTEDDNWFVVSENEVPNADGKYKTAVLHRDNGVAVKITPNKGLLFDPNGEGLEW